MDQQLDPICILSKMLCISSDESGTRNQPQNGFELVEGILEVHFLTNYFLGIGNSWISKFRNRFTQSSYLHHHLYIPNHNKILHILFLVCHRFLSTQFCLQFLKSYENVHQLNDVCNCSIQQEMVILYTEILTEKVVLWCFFSSETSEKIHNSTFQVKLSV